MTTGKQMRSGLMILACSLLFVAGCDVTLGPKVEKKTIIVQSGTGIEILDNVTVHGRVTASNADGSYDEIKQDIGGWVAMHPNHWQSLKAEVVRLKKKCGEN